MCGRSSSMVSVWVSFLLLSSGARRSLSFSISDLIRSTLRRAPNSSMVSASGLILISTGSDFQESARSANC